MCAAVTFLNKVWFPRTRVCLPNLTLYQMQTSMKKDKNMLFRSLVAAALNGANLDRWLAVLFANQEAVCTYYRKEESMMWRGDAGQVRPVLSLRSLRSLRIRLSAERADG